MDYKEVLRGIERDGEVREHKAHQVVLTSELWGQWVEGHSASVHEGGARCHRTTGAEMQNQVKRTGECVYIYRQTCPGIYYTLYFCKCWKHAKIQLLNFLFFLNTQATNNHFMLFICWVFNMINNLFLISNFLKIQMPWKSKRKLRSHFWGTANSNDHHHHHHVTDKYNDNYLSYL